MTVRIEIDGRLATEEGLRPVALVNYGHFTAMQVRRRRVRGIDLHLRRLVSATQELFGVEIDQELIRDRVRHALQDTADASVRVNVFQREDEGIAVMVVVRAQPRWPTPHNGSCRCRTSGPRRTSSMWARSA